MTPASGVDTGMFKMFRSIFKFVAVLAALVASPAAAEVSATFNYGAIAEYQNSGLQNVNAYSFDELQIASITMKQAGTGWGGTNGNDLSVTLTIDFIDASKPDLLITGAALNWQKNDGGSAPLYFGVTVATQVLDTADGYGATDGVFIRGSNPPVLFTRTRPYKTYILALPSKILSTPFNALVTNDDVTGSANFKPADLFAALTADFGGAAPPANGSPAFQNQNAGSGTSYSFNYDENSLSGVVIDTVTAIDPEGGSVTYSIAGGNDNNWYYIDPSTGEITLTADGAASLANDFEQGPNTQTLTVSVFDGTNVTTVQVALNETDVDDRAPVFTDQNADSGSSYSFSYPENSVSGVVIDTVTANDPDGGSLTFSITGGDDDDWYDIDPATGEITLTPAGAASLANDFEQEANTRTLTVSVSDGTNDTTVEVTLNETNKDEADPVITGPNGGAGAAESTRSVFEGQTDVTRLVADEPVTWEITAGDDLGEFEIAEDGTITFLAAPDFESPTDSDTNNTYVLTITATDADGNVSTQTITVTILDVDEAAPVITGPSGGPGAANSALTITEGLTAVTSFTANEPVTWSIDSGTDAGKFQIDPETGAITFVAAPDFENPTDSDLNNTYVVRIKAVDAVGNASYQTLTVTIINVDEIARKLGEIGDKLRGSLRNYAAHGLSDMLAFNESLMASNDDVCADPKAKKALSGSARANEKGGSVDVQYAQRLSDCSRPHQLFADAGLTYSRMGGNWNSRIFGGLRFETKVNSELTLGLGALASRSSDQMTGFETSSISDKSLQINAYGRYNISDTLRTGGFVGMGKSWYDFALTETDGFDLDGKMTGKRQIFGLMLSGDFNLGETVVTTDAIISHAREKLGSATLAAQYLGEDRSDIAFAVGTVDVTRISVPVTAPITLTGSPDYGSYSRVLLSPGLLCEDNDVQSSAMRCGYQLGAKLVAYDGGRSRLYANYQWESVAGMRRAIMGAGVAHRVGKRNDLELALEVNRGAVGFAREDNRAMLAIRLAQ